MAPMISKEALNRTAHQILGAAIDVHAAVGPGVMERAYFECLARELHERGLRVDAHVPIPLVYRDIRLDCVYRADLVVENCVVVEVKALDTVAPIHLQQLYTYLRLGDYRLGLLLNFGGATLKAGIRRVVNRFPDE